MHHEMAQTNDPPSHILFHCEKPSISGGETPLIDSRLLARFVKEEYPECYDRFRAGVRYKRVMPEYNDQSTPLGRGWRDTYGVRSVREMDARAKALELTHMWRKRDLITLSPLLPAVRVISCNATETTDVFFNSIIAAYNGWNDARNTGTHAVLFADGTSVSSETMIGINNFVEANKVAIPWEKGGVLLVDNRVTMHSRHPFEGPRRVLASMGTLAS